MKLVLSIVTIIVTCIMAFLLLGLVLSPASTALPAVSSASAAALEATPTTVPTVNAASTQPVQSTCDAKRSIQVSGSAAVNVAPDRALVQLGVESNGGTTQAVEAINSDAIEAVMNAVKAQGVDAKDIATDWYVIEPIYENYDSLYIKGYRIHNTIAITVRDVSKTSRIVSTALQSGANQVINVDFYTTDLRKYRDQAREMAMKAAREKAQALASAAGAEAGCVLSINENSWSYYTGWGYGGYGRGQSQNQWTQNVVQNIAPSSAGSGAGGGASSGSGDEPINPGQISVKAEISASFALK